MGVGETYQRFAVKKLFLKFHAHRQGLLVLALLGGLVFNASAKTNLPLAGQKNFGLTNRPAVGAFLNGVMPEVAPGISGNWSAVVAFTNLFFTNSVGLTHVPDSNQLCVWEREGRVWTFDNSSGTTQKKLVLDVSQQCQGWDDSGLLGIAFHPSFAS